MREQSYPATLIQCQSGACPTQHALESPRALVKTQVPSHSVGLRFGLRSPKSNEFPGADDAAGSWTTFWLIRVWGGVPVFGAQNFLRNRKARVPQDSEPVATPPSFPPPHLSHAVSVRRWMLWNPPSTFSFDFRSAHRNALSYYIMVFQSVAFLVFL